MRECVECGDRHPKSDCPKCGACDFSAEFNCWNCGE